MCWDCFINSDLCAKYTHPHCKKDFFFRKGTDKQYILEHDTHKDFLCLSECKEAKCSYKEEMFEDEELDEEDMFD